MGLKWIIMQLSIMHEGIYTLIRTGLLQMTICGGQIKQLVQKQNDA